MAVPKSIEAPIFFSDNNYNTIWHKLISANFGHPGCKRCPLEADLLSFGYEQDLVLSLSGDKQAEIIEVLNFTSQQNIAL